VENLARGYSIGTEVLDLDVEAPVAGPYVRATSWEPERTPVLYRLLLLNILLQIFDGIATYSGLHVGIREANPLLRSAFHLWGVVPTLAIFKVQACALLLFVYRAAGEQVAILALTVLATVYSVCSLIPWLVMLVSLCWRFM
jgi:hypothetical protein